MGTSHVLTLQSMCILVVLEHSQLVQSGCIQLFYMLQSMWILVVLERSQLVQERRTLLGKLQHAGARIHTPSRPISTASAWEYNILLVRSHVLRSVPTSSSGIATHCWCTAAC
jgi:hypothetical protein